jgi:hypothetical protein
MNVDACVRLPTSQSSCMGYYTFDSDRKSDVVREDTGASSVILPDSRGLYNLSLGYVGMNSNSSDLSGSPLNCENLENTSEKILKGC